ncbi:MAG: NnrS family protein [Devosia sp.]
MPPIGISPRSVPHKPVPRGIATSGPAILSYGFRPFSFCAGTYAALAMVLWIGALSGLWPIGGPEGPVAWHAHEMLFGYAAAALGGFILTAVPNWTGRLPVSGRPLLLLLGLWLVGRCVGAAPALLGAAASAVIDALFLPVLAFVVAREVITGHNHQNLRVAIGISVLAALNIAFHLMVLVGGDVDLVLRATVGLYVLLVCNIGGRIIPSFTRNYLARQSATRLPAPMDRLDHIALGAALLAILVWAVFPQGWPTALLCVIAAGLHAWRLGRWRGVATWREPLLLVLHCAYAFVPIGLVAAAVAAVGPLAEASALHLLTVGVIGLTTLAVMTRAARGHTGRPLTASAVTATAYLCVLLAAISRPLAEIFVDFYQPLLMLAGTAWIAAFVLFATEHAPILWLPSPASKARKGK